MSYTKRACAIDLSLQSLLQCHSIKETGADIWCQRLRKFTFTAVHTKTHRRHFQIYPLWRAFLNLCVYSERFHCLGVGGRPKRIKKFAFTSVCVYSRLCVDGAWIDDLVFDVSVKFSSKGKWLPLQRLWVGFLSGTLKIFSVFPSPIAKQRSVTSFMLRGLPVPFHRSFKWFHYCNKLSLLTNYDKKLWETMLLQWSNVSVPL